MNRQQRRAARTKWAADMRVAVAESGGLMNLAVIDPLDILLVLADALAGEPEAARIAPAILAQIERVSAPAKGLPPALCGTCDRELTTVSYSIAVATPRRDRPERAITIGICHHCAIDSADIRKKAVEGFQRLFPDAKQVVLQGHEAGHA
jgi:hypothetical protein